MSSKAVKPLACRVWWSFVTMRVLMILFILSPIILVLNAVVLNIILVRANVTKIGTERFHDEAPVQSWSRKQLLTGSEPFVDLKVSPNTDIVKRVMESVKNSPDYNAGDVVITYLENNDDSTSSRDQNATSGFRVIFSEATTDKLEYTLRYRRPKMWPTSKHFIEDGNALDFPSSGYCKYFLPLQIAIDESFLNASKEKTRALTNLDWQISSNPYPSHSTVRGSAMRLWLVEVVLFMGIFPLVSRLASLTNQDKVSGINELLNMNGVPKWMFNISWLTCFGLITFFVALVQMILLQIPIDKGWTMIPFLNWFFLFVILVVYYWAALCSASFIVTILTSPVLMTPILWAYWLLTFAVCFALVFTKSQKSTVGMVFMALLPNGGMVLVFEGYSHYEAASVLLCASNALFWPENCLPVGLTLIIMILSMFMYYLLAVYMNSVRPGPYGTARPWYLYRRKKPVPKTRESVTPESSAPYFENVGHDVPIGLKVTNLVKKFGSFTANNNLNLNIVKNQITVLLGHNGAGKSTFFNILSGFLAPTSGNVATEDYDIFEGGNIVRFRQEIGYCPQHNFLLNDLTVEQHLLLFGMLKGMTRQEATKQSNSWADRFGIEPANRKKRVAKLSGGLKRKVCLAMAMVSGPKYLLLDEPSSGLDPESRREIWDVLLTVRGTCTIIITTHFMEEADVLSDRIAIMAHGRLKCFGTKMFLKKKYGFGYKLNATIVARENGLLRRVQRHAPSAETANETDRTIEIKIPASEIEKFPSLLRDLESDKRLDWTLAYSTVDDIFLKVQEEEGEQIKVGDMPTAVDMPKISACFGVLQQIIGLFILKAKWTLQNWKVAIFFTVFWPIFSMVATLLACELTEAGYFQEKYPKVKLTLDTYGGFFGLMATKDGDVVGERLQTAITSSGSSFEVIKPGDNLDAKLKSFSEDQRLEYNSRMVFAFDTRSQPKAYFSTVAYHSAPIAYRALINGLYPDKTIISYNHPFAPGEDCKNYNDLAIIIIWIMLAAPAALNLPHFCLTYPHVDRMTLFRHLQMITGIAPPIYWLSLFIFDYLVYLVFVAVMVVCILLADITKLFSEPSVLSVIVIVLLLHGIGGMFIAYLCSFFFRRYTNAMELYSQVQFLGFVVGFAMDFMTKGYITYFYFLPWVVLGSSLAIIIRWTTAWHVCHGCKHGKSGCEKIAGQTLMGNLRLEIIWFIVDAFLYLIIIVCVDLGLWAMLMTLIKKGIFGGIEPDPENNDPDVKMEKQRVRDIRNRDKGDVGKDTAILISDGLGKKYKKRVVVNDVTFGMGEGECFGLLGPNGAGKSTTFGMLAGSVTPTAGDAVIADCTLSKRSFQYLRRVGYCPQLEGLMGDLSARVLITHFMRLRRYPPKQIKSLTNRWIEALGMTDICDRACKNYSGGNKKKLSLVIALIGNPTVVFLDEPSTGVDVVIMRRIWEVLKHCLDTNKQTIVITSHSMTECEAVCGRLTVLANGMMKCIGTVPKLKTMFGTSRVVQVKLVPSCTESQQNEIQSKIESAFSPNIQIQDKQRCFLSFHVHAEAAKLSDLFSSMIKLKKNHSEIEDFNVEDASFEQAFISFTRDQQHPRKSSKSESKPPGRSSEIRMSSS